MANKELTDCDYAGCTKPFRYLNNGLKLCYQHLSEKENDRYERAAEFFREWKAKNEAKNPEV